MGTVVDEPAPTSKPEPAIPDILDGKKHATERKAAREKADQEAREKAPPVPFGEAVPPPRLETLALKEIHEDPEIQPRGVSDPATEIFGSDVGGYFFSHQYQQAGLRVDENSIGEFPSFCGYP